MLNKINTSKASKALSQTHALSETKNLVKTSIDETLSSDEYKDSLYPKDHTPVLPQILKQTEKQEQSKTKKTGREIINELEDFQGLKKYVLSLYDDFEDNLDAYVQKINSFDIDNDKKLSLICVIVNNFVASEGARVLPQTKQLLNFLSDPDVQNKIKETDMCQNVLIKLSSINVGNYDHKTLSKIIFQDKYNFLPNPILNHIGTSTEPQKQLEYFYKHKDLIENVFSIIKPELQLINGKDLYNLSNFMINTDENSSYENLQYKDLIFYRDFLENSFWEQDNYLFLLVKNENEMFLKLRPQLALKPNEEKEKIKEKLDNVKEILIQKMPKLSPEQKLALTNILQVENGLKNFDIENMDVNKSTIEQNETLKYLFNAIPGLFDTIGIRQNGHSYTLDKHILSVAQHVVKNENYKKLDENNKKLLLIAALMHDITKKEGGSDPTHPQTGAEFAHDALKDALSPKDCSTVANLIYNHHFNQTVSQASEIAMFNFAYECAIDKNSEFMQMLKILGEADLQGNPKLRDRYMPLIPKNFKTLEDKVLTIQSILNDLKTQLELTPFPEKTNVEKNEKMEKDLKEKGIIREYITSEKGTNLPVIDLSKMKDVENEEEQKKYFEYLGFGKGTTCNSLNLLVHAIRLPEHIDGVEKIANSYKQDAILSTSNITMSDTALFDERYCGFVFDSFDTNILNYKDKNINSGNRKTRSQISHFVNCSNNQTKEETKKILDGLKNKKGHSEIITTDVSVGAVFVKAQKYNDPATTIDKNLKSLFSYAKKYEIPVVLIP